MLTPERKSLTSTQMLQNSSTVKWTVPARIVVLQGENLKGGNAPFVSKVVLMLMLTCRVAKSRTCFRILIQVTAMTMMSARMSEPRVMIATGTTPV